MQSPQLAVVALGGHWQAPGPVFETSAPERFGVDAKKSDSCDNGKSHFFDASYFMNSMSELVDMISQCPQIPNKFQP